MTMGKHGNRIIKDLEIGAIIETLNRAYADEWLAYYQYYIESKIVKGIMKDAIIAELDQHAADELRHASMIAGRIAQLGGVPLLSPEEMIKHSGCGYTRPENFDVVGVLEDAIDGEQCAIDTYSSILEMTRNRDVVTYDLVSSILADEVEHEEDLQALYDDISEFIDDMRRIV